MPKFVFTYHGSAGMEQTEEERNASFAEWGNWLGSLAGSLVDAGNPVAQTKTVKADGAVADGTADPLGGFSLIQAGSIEEACVLAKGCPIFRSPTGRVAVSELIEM